MINNQKQAAMAEANRLTKAGRLAEATGLIKQTLKGFPLKTETGSTFSPVETVMKEPEKLPQPTGTSTSKPLRAENKRESTGLFLKEQLKGLAGVFNTVPTPSGLSNFGLASLENQINPGITNNNPHYTPTGLKGQFVDRVFTNTAGSRNYKLYIPGGYYEKEGTALPLVIMLHGCTQSALDFASGTQMNQLAEEHLFLVAYPEQPMKANNSRCWNWFQANHQERGKGEPALIAGITREITGDYRVDTARIYVAGLSAGGAMAAIMAATYPDLYAAFGVHSGLAYGAARTLPSALTLMRQGESSRKREIDRFIPLIVFQGDQDTTVSPVNADNLIDQWLMAAHSSSIEVNFPDREATEERNRKSGGHAYSRTNYKDRNGNPILENWVIHQAGHAWSGGNPSGSFTDPRGPNASAEMLRFFLEHTRQSGIDRKKP